MYSGSAFQCPDREITLRNDEFGSDSSIGACDSEQLGISGRGLMEVDNCYTSQVNISLGEVVPQSTVSCSVEGTQEEVVDTAEITVSTGNNTVMLLVYTDSQYMIWGVHY